MKYIYPVSHDIPTLSDAALSLKIARHSPCSACECRGLRPPSRAELALDDTQTHTLLGGLTQYGSDDDDGSNQSPYLNVCECSHDLSEHGASKAELGPDEFARRGRVGVRLDELLQDIDKLLDFDYVDEDILSLRRQMALPVSSLSPPADVPDSPRPSPVLPVGTPTSSDLSDESPPTKRRKISISSLSDADDDDDDDDDDEEDKPLAARMLPKPSTEHAENGIRPSGQRAGKKMPSMKSKAQTAPTSLPVPTRQEQAEMNGHANGINGHETRVKVEDRMDEGQLTRLVTGVTVDTGGTALASSPVRTEKPATVELRRGIIQITAVENDGQPRSWIILTGLKTLFQKQLPKMPREYIARLVYDANSKCLAIIKRGYKVVGGICYRPFPHRGFAEIVFFATASVDQVKGYGGMLMDHFKAHIRRTYPDMLYFLTYADNYAVGYFKKQGFSKDITLDRSVWAGYIKDYEGGTIMQCTMLQKVDYLRKAEIVTQQREAILTKIREKSKSHIVYDGLPQFQDGAGEGITLDPKDVPGLRESGWTPEMLSDPVRVVSRGAEHAFMQRLLSDLQSHPLAWAFLQPVNGDEVADYYDVIKKPMDFSTMEHKLETGQYPFLNAFLDDAQLVFDNCRLYNPEGSIYAKNATKLEKFLRDQVSANRDKY